MDERDAKIAQLEATIKNLQKTKPNDGEKAENETWVASADRRLQAQTTTREYFEMIAKICKEVEKKIPSELGNLIMSLRGTRWPVTVKSCMKYNTESCEGTFGHGEGAGPDRNRFKRLHICAVSNLNNLVNRMNLVNHMNLVNLMN